MSSHLFEADGVYTNLNQIFSIIRDLRSCEEGSGSAIDKRRLQFVFMGLVRNRRLILPNSLCQKVGEIPKCLRKSVRYGDVEVPTFEGTV